MPKLKLDEAAVRAVGLPDGKRQVIYWDEKTRGFGLLVSVSTKTFIYQRDLPGGATRRVTLGRYPLMTLTQARQDAARKYAAMIDGVDPSAQRRERVREQKRKEHEAFTLRKALASHLSDMRSKQCAPRSITSFEDRVARLLASWLDRPLVEITRKECIEKHRQLTAKHGPVAANGTLRSFRACWRSAQRLFEHLPPHPVFVVYNKQVRKRSPIPWADLPAWWAGVEAIDNPVRRDLNWLVLFTGLRSEDARKIRWEHIDFDKGTLHRPKPKGGVDRAFTIPLAAYLLALLAKRKLANVVQFGDDKGWVFATVNDAGAVTHVVDARRTGYVPNPKTGGVKKVTTAPTMHRLRDTFATACLEASVGMLETKVLMNHSLPSGSVTEGYMRPSLDHLRLVVERVAAFLLGKAGQASAQGVAGGRKLA
jgi:integrase